MQRSFVSAILDTVDALVIVLDPAGGIVRFNRACEQITGYSFDEVRGRLIWDLLIPPEEVEPVKATFEQLRAGQFPNKSENHWLAKNGSHHLITWSNTALLDERGSVEYIIGTGIDVTELRRVERRLVEERTLLRTLIDSVPDHIAAKDNEGRYTLLNQAYAHFLEARTPDELIGKTVFDLYPPELARQIDADDRTIIQTGQSLVSQEKALVGPDGERYWVLGTKVLLRDSQGQIIGLVGIDRDITRRKQLEEGYHTLVEQSLQEKDRLLEAVRQQREQLRALARRLAEVEDAERKQLARELHDQIGQNLTALGLNLNIVRSEIASPVPQMHLAQARLNDSLILVEEMAERIRDVMANLRAPVLDDYGLVAALRWYGTQFASRTGLTVTVEGEGLDPRLPPPIENALFSIVQEALTNVAKHAQASQVTVSIEADEETMRLVVADNGVGFEVAALTGDTKRQGWGLLIMSERAEAVGGSFRIKTAPGQGTRVTVEVRR